MCYNSKMSYASGGDRYLRAGQVGPLPDSGWGDWDDYGQNQQRDSYGQMPETTRRHHRAPRQRAMRRLLATVLTATVTAAAGAAYVLNREGPDTPHTIRRPVASAPALPHHVTKSSHARPTQAPAPPRYESYDASACFKPTSAGQTINMACVEAVIPQRVPRSIQKDLGALVSVTVGVIDKHLVTTNQQTGKKEYGSFNNQLTGARVNFGSGPVQTLTAGHMNEGVRPGHDCLTMDSSVAAGGSLDHAGFTLPLTGFQTNYHKRPSISNSNVDEASVFVAGDAAAMTRYNNLPTIHAEADAQSSLQPGALLMMTSYGPRLYGAGQNQQNPSSELATDRKPIEEWLLYLGQADANNGMFIPVGSADNMRPYVIGGDSGSPLIDPKDGHEDAVLVQSGHYIASNTPKLQSPATFASETGDTLLYDGAPSDRPVQMVIGQFLEPNGVPGSVVNCRP